MINRNDVNLLELPTLFYPVCILFYVTGRVTLPIVALAWVFAVARVAHSLIHIGYNNVQHRLAAFGAGNAALAALWVLFFIQQGLA